MGRQCKIGGSANLGRDVEDRCVDPYSIDAGSTRETLPIVPRGVCDSFRGYKFMAMAR